MNQASVDLTSFVEKMGGERALRVEETLGAGFVRLRVAEAERRQAKHDIRCVEDIVIELLRNARDAGAQTIFVATAREGNERSIVMLDDGDGIPPELWRRIFDARVTSKLETVHMDRWGVHGRGMALYSIRENTLEARVAASILQGGSAISVLADVERLPERSDQSSWPKLVVDDDGEPVIGRGPHNIYRTCSEFALEERGRCTVFVGSPAEMVATMRHRVRPSSDTRNLLDKRLDEIPVLERFSVASDARELVEASEGCALTLSTRTAQRIIAGQVAAVKSVLAHLGMQDDAAGRRPVNLARDQRGLRLSEADRQAFLGEMERAFEELGERYYLRLSREPRLRVSGTRLTVTFDYEGED